MNRIVAFYSKDGNSKALANVLSDRFGCELYEVKEAKKRGKGPMSFMNCGRQAFFGLKSRLAFDAREKFLPYDSIVLVSPVWAGRLSPAVNAVLCDADLTGHEVTLFACQASPELEALKSIKTKFKKTLSDKGAIYKKCYCVQGASPGKEPFSYERFDGFLKVLLKDGAI